MFYDILKENAKEEMGMKKLFLMLLCGGILAGCSSGGVSQEEYESVVAERDEYKAALESMSYSSEDIETDAVQESTDAEVGEGENNLSINSAVEMVAEYTLSDSIGWYSRHFMIFKNNSDVTVDISTSSLAYTSDGTMVSAADASFEALGAGCTSIVYEAFETEAEIDHYETKINVMESDYYESVIQDLSYVQNDIDGGAIFQVTNNGEEVAEFVEGYALFFLGDKLVEYSSTYFTDDDSEIKPGDTISKQMDSYEDFDRIEFYLTGRRSAW